MTGLLWVYGGLAVLGPVFWACQRRWPAAEGAPGLGRGRAVDWLFWLITPCFSGALTLAVTLWIGIAAATALGRPVCTGSGLALRCAPLTALEGLPARWPLWVQAGLALLLVDLLSYLSHRARHRWAWRWHALHHTPTRLDWLAAARLHPLDDLLDNTFVMTPVLLLGFDHRLVLAIGPALLLHTVYLHAAVDWRLGAIAPFLASPRFHRAHHALGVEGNYGGVLSLWDHLLGTAVAPEGVLRFGAAGPARSITRPGA